MDFPLGLWCEVGSQGDGMVGVPSAETTPVIFDVTWGS